MPVRFTVINGSRQAKGAPRDQEAIAELSGPEIKKGENYIHRCKTDEKEYEFEWPGGHSESVFLYEEVTCHVPVPTVWRSFTAALPGELDGELDSSV